MIYFLISNFALVCISKLEIQSKTYKLLLTSLFICLRPLVSVDFPSEVEESVHCIPHSCWVIFGCMTQEQSDQTSGQCRELDWLFPVRYRW